MRSLTRTLLVALLLVPILWVWPQRGITAKFHPNKDWLRPTVVSVERQMNLDFMTAASAPLPQRDFSVEWSGWLRTDRDGQYTFDLRSDDGSSLELDGHVVVDASRDVLFPTHRTATIAVRRGLHQIRARFVQTDGAYEFYAYWTPPGEVDLAPFPTQQLFVEQQPAVIVYLTRHVLVLWVLCWFALALVISARIATNAREISGAASRQFARRLTLALASTIAALLAAEGIVRLMHYLREDRRPLEVQLRGARDRPPSMQSLRLGEIVQQSRDPGIVYELKPNVRGRFMGQPLIINSQGLRDYEYTRRKQPGTFRIVGVGDSSLFGWGVPLEDSGLKVLERRLNEKSRAQKFEVINFAVPGYNTAMESETFVQRCLEYTPDLVLLNFNTNDYDVPGFMRLPDDLATFRKSYLFDLAYSAYAGVMAVEREPLGVFDFKRTISEDQGARLDEDPALPEEYRYMVGAKGVVRALEQVAAAARKRAIPFVVFTVKPYPGVVANYVRDELRDGQRELLERESQRLGFHFLNTYRNYMDYLNRYPNANFAVSRADGHPNALAHSIDADAIFNYLVAHQLVP